MEERKITKNKDNIWWSFEFNGNRRFFFWIHTIFRFNMQSIRFFLCLSDRKCFNNSRKLFIIPLKLPNICLPPIVWQASDTQFIDQGNHFSISFCQSNEFPFGYLLPIFHPQTYIYLIHSSLHLKFRYLFHHNEKIHFYILHYCDFIYGIISFIFNQFHEHLCECSWYILPPFIHTCLPVINTTLYFILNK